MNVEFEFGIGQDVTIKRTSAEGTVKGLHIDEDGSKQALVSYGDAQSVLHLQWIRFEELMAAS